MTTNLTENTVAEWQGQRHKHTTFVLKTLKTGIFFYVLITYILYKFNLLMQDIHPSDLREFMIREFRSHVVVNRLLWVLPSVVANAMTNHQLVEMHVLGMF